MDNKFDEIDNMIFNYFSDKTVPDIIENGIATAMYKDYNVRKVGKLIREIIITIISFLTISGGIVFAKDIEKFIKNIFGAREGIETAVQNGYIANPNMEYVESNNVKIKIDDILVDDYNLNINFNISPSDKVSEINDIYLSSVLITDENRNILYCKDENLFYKYCGENNLDYDYMEFNEKYVNNGFNYSIKDKNLEENTLNLVYNFSAYGTEYSKSKELKIYINELSYKTNKNEKIKGDWKMEINNLEKFYNRENMEYKEISSNDENVKLLKAVVYDTELKIELEIYDEGQEELRQTNLLQLRYDMQKELEEYNVVEQIERNIRDKGEHDYIGPATEKYLKVCEKLYEPITKVYIENEKGEKFEITKSTSENMPIKRDYEKNVLEYANTFDITKYDVTEKLKIHFKLEGVDKVIEIER